ncbi:MAG: sugar MFS transporter [Bacteroidetes bacterium]|nr:sugar MFS transporter [Bacteroidota bacterium]MCL2301785.1 sugar MFS transporter [Lentimicrobiaceae bacterium]
MQNNKTTFSIFIIGALFFVFGFVTWLNSVLIPFLKTACELTDTEASLVPFAFYISYFVMAIPSSFILKRTGFTNGMMLGLIVMAIGSLVFVPAALHRNYMLFLVGLFTQGTGLALLQTATNPYVTILGPIESAAQRISIMGICNKIAGMIGVLVLFSALFSSTEHLLVNFDSITNVALREKILQQLSNSVIFPYLVMTAVLLGLVLFIKMAKLPEIHEEEKMETKSEHSSIFAYPYLWFGIAAIFFYVGVEVVAIDYLIVYANDLQIPTEISRYYPIAALLALVVGYTIGIALVPKVISQRTSLIFNASLGLILAVVALCTTGKTSIYAIIGLSFSHAIMWPAIWPLSIHNLGKYTKLASAFLIMAIAGGAILPLIYGVVADKFGTHSAYSVMLPGYVYLIVFAVVLCKIKKWK